MHRRIGRDGSESTTSPPKLLKVDQAAAELAVSVRTVWRLLAIGELKPVRVGRSVRVPRASIEKFVEKGGAR